MHVNPHRHISFCMLELMLIILFTIVTTTTTTTIEYYYYYCYNCLFIFKLAWAVLASVPLQMGLWLYRTMYLKTLVVSWGDWTTLLKLPLGVLPRELARHWDRIQIHRKASQAIIWQNPKQLPKLVRARHQIFVKECAFILVRLF